MSLYSRLDRLAADQTRLERKFDALANSPQAQRTSIEAGTMDVNDEDGNLVSTIGLQEDGSGATRFFDGPVPPPPTAPILSVDGPVITSEWDGGYDGEPTYDLDHIDVIASGPSGEVLRGTMTLGGTRTCLLAATVAGEWTVRFEAVSKAGKVSLSSPFATVTVELVGLTGAIEAVQDSANGKNRIYYSPTEPEPPEGGFNNGDLWFDTSEDGNNVASVWNGSGWVSLEDARIAAIQAAQEELSSDLQDVMTSVDGKTTITFDPAAPTSARPGKAVGDLWYRTSGNSIIGFWKWTGTSWVAQMLAATVIPLIDIGAGTFGSLSGTRLDAYSVTAEKVLIGAGSELTVNPFFDNEGAGWGSSTGGASFTYSADAAYTGHSYGLKAVPTVGGTTIYFTSLGSTGTQRIVMEHGKTYKVEAWVRRTAGNVSNLSTLQLRGYFYSTATGGTLSNQLAAGGSIQASSVPADTWVKVTGVYTPPSPSYVYMYPRPTIYTSSNHPADAATWHLGMISIKEQVGATLIENGAITTDKLAVGAITAESGIIASFDLGNGTVGELDGIRIASKTIGAEQLRADFADFIVARGGTFLTSNGGGQWSDDGLFISAPDGTSLVRFPTDGTPLSLSASDVQIDRSSIAELDVLQETVRSGGTLSLASGVTPPASPPELSLGWESVAEFDRPSPGSTFDWLGLGAWGSKWVRAVNVLGAAGDTLDAFEVYSANGSLEKKISLDINPRAGVTVIGDVAYTIGPDQNSANAGKLWVHGFNLNTGVRVTRWQFTRFTLSTQAKIAIGNDGTNLVVAGVHPTANTLYVLRYNPATGAQVGSDMTDTSYDVKYTKELQGVYITGSVAYVAHAKDTRRYAISGGTLTRTENGWRNPETDAAGLAFTTTPFIVSQSGELYRGSTFQDSTIEACYTWWDGTRETTPSPIAALDMQAARVVSVSLARRAGLQKRFYYRSGSGNWARQTLDQDITSVTIYTPNPSASNYPPPTVNSFPNADPALLTSTNQRFQVLGDGSGKWGPLTFNADGTMTSTAIPAWVPVTSFLNGSAPASFGFAPAYRIWPDGKVEWRGSLTVNNATGMTEVITVPAAAVPAQFVPRPVSCNGGSGGGIAHAEIAQPGAANKIRTRPVSGTLSWISLDGFFYYLT